MTTALDQKARSALERFVQEARHLLEDDLAREAEGRFGIQVDDGAVENEDGLHLDPTGLAARRDVVEVLEFLRREEASGAEAVARLIREAAFTHLNRLIAIRIAEAIELLPESIARGASSAGFKEVLEVAPLLAHDASGGYWRYLQLCGDELAADLPQLFDPRNPLLELAPSPAAFDELVEMIGSADLGSVWDAPDALGWSYQFFNSGDERRAMRDASASPRNSRELAVRNQFFTPRYVVDFLVQNSLGRRLLEADPGSPLRNELPLLLDPPNDQGDPVDLHQVRVLDPACGSGHFLLASYDLLERAWELRGVQPSEAASKIVSSLWGIDIDVRCSQVAAAAVVLRARRHCKSGDLPAPNIITARALPQPSEGWDLLLASLPDDRQRLVVAIRDALEQAPILGPLLRVEQLLADEIRSRVTGAADDSSTLFGVMGVSSDAFGRAESDVMAVLQDLADSATSTAASRLLAAEAHDAIRFVEAMRHRYDVVLMNPPFGLPVPEAERYLRSAYPSTWTDLYGAFVERARDLAAPSGYISAIVSSQWFATRTMRRLRSSLIREANPVCLADLGAGILEGATVNTCLLVVAGCRRIGMTRYADFTEFPRLELPESLARQSVWRTVDFGSFAAIDGNPIAVHVPDAVLQRWVSPSRLEPDIAVVRTGNHTFDDFRFLRLAWEVVDSDGWHRFQKGGEYCPYWSSTPLLVDWRNDGDDMRRFAMERVGSTAQVMQSSTLWFGAGLTFPHVSSVGFGVRVLPAGEIFSSESISIFPKNSQDRIVLLGILNSTITSELLQVFGRNRKFENGAIKALPFGQGDLRNCSAVEPYVLELIAIFRELEGVDETSILYESPFVGDANDLNSANNCLATLRERAAVCQTEIDTIVARALDVTDRIDTGVAARVELLERAIRADWSQAEWSHTVLSFLLSGAFERLPANRVPSRSLASNNVFEAVRSQSTSGGRETEATNAARESRESGALLLVDEVGHANDVEAAILRALVQCKENLGLDDGHAVAEGLSSGSVRTYLRSKFFKTHLKQYSRSHRKAPIYWPLTVPSGRWGVWVYAPRLSRETLYAVASEALRREGLAEAEIARLERERASGGAGRGVKALDKALDDERKLAEELRRFREEAERIAGLGWEPDLNDGILLCAAPLANLFPMWKEPAKYCKELRAGKYEWATVARWADQI